MTFATRRRNHLWMRMLTLISRTAARKVPNYPLLNSTPTSISPSVNIQERDPLLAAMPRGSPHIEQLLGRTEDGSLVFPRFKQDFLMTVMLNKDEGRIRNIRRWMLNIIDGVEYLHSLGIVHRDLTMRKHPRFGSGTTCHLRPSVSACHRSLPPC